MEYWQDLYHELEQQKERGLREGKKEGMIEGAQQAFIMSVFIYLVLLMFFGAMKQEVDPKVEYPAEFISNVYHIGIILVSIFFLVKTLVNDKLLIGNLTLEEARTEGTKYAYRKTWMLQHNRYQSIGVVLIALLNAIVYWMIAILFNLFTASEVFKNEVTAIVVMIILNLVFIIPTVVLKR